MTAERPTVELTTDGVAAGGEAIGRHPDGRVVLVAGGLPGERLLVHLQEDHRSWLRGVVVEVGAAAPGRVAPPCPEVARGCGGCDLQHADHPTQLALKAEVVADALRRVGRLADPPPVERGPALPATAYRTSARAAVVGGRAGFRHRRSHDVVAVGRCLVAHPLLEELVVEGRYPGAREVAIRVGAATGERMVVVSPAAEGVEVPGDVLVVGADELAAGRRAWVHEQVVGRTWRVSAGSFFQASPQGAAALVEVVRGAVGDQAVGRLADLYAGVGLFAGTVAAERVVAVERGASSAADARHNLADLAAKVVRSTVERWRPSRADLVVADPARSGLGRAGVQQVLATGAATVVLVSCDPAAFGRDAAALTAGGLQLERVVLVDLFPGTSHVEVVSCFRRE